MKATVLSLAVLCVAAGTVKAQTYSSGGPICRGVPHWGPVWYGPTTVAESYARGRADLIRSRGLYNLLTSQVVGQG